MKLVILSAIVAVGLAAPQSLKTDVRYAAILRQDNDIYPDGSYHYAYDTENGISGEESGQQKPIGEYVGNAAQGSYSYTSPEGVNVVIQYVADENGFQPVGNVIPTAPPLPEAIARSIQINAAAAQQPANPYRRF